MCLYYSSNRPKTMLTLACTAHPEFQLHTVALSTFILSLSNSWLDDLVVST